MKTQTGARAIILFVTTAYALSIALSLVVGFTGGHESRFMGLALLSMFLPALSLLFVNLTLGEPLRVQWDHLPLGYLPIALFLIPVVLHVVALTILVKLGDGVQWQDWLTPQADGLYHTPGSRGWGVLTTQGLVGHIVLNGIVGLFANSLLAFFEEIGWRGWLLPRLFDRLGARSAVIVTAIIWAFWHTPFQLSGIQHIDGISPWRLVVAMPVGIIAAGLILGWLWLRTESIWLVSIAHGALNDWGQYAFKYMKDSTTPQEITMDGHAIGAGFLVVLIIGVLLLWFAVRSQPQSSLERGTSTSV